MSAPAGCNCCATCGQVSAVYALWPTCRECQDACCPQCMMLDSLEEDDRDYDTEHGPVARLTTTVLCRQCSTCERCRRSGVPVRYVRVGGWSEPSHDELVCYACQRSSDGPRSEAEERGDA